MNTDKENIQKEIENIELEMNGVDFWNDKNLAQEKILKLKKLKLELEGDNEIDSGGAIMNILAGSGGDDSEDWVRILLNMYLKFFEKNNCEILFLHENKNDNNGYRNISFEINGKIKIKEKKFGIYKAIKNESGVHRLVRISPFNANAKRHTSFAMVEILPIIPKLEFDKFKNEIRSEDLEIETLKASGPGGQNVNKRETAVRIIHKSTNISAHVASERSQEQNKEKAMQILFSKLFKLAKEKNLEKIDELKISKIVDIEWGNQIRNYVFHPYKLIKDIRTGVEITDIESVLEKGELEEFINAEIC